MPRRAKAGELIAVVSPAGPVEKAQLNRGIAVLEQWGYRVKLAKNTLQHRDYLSGSDAERAADLQQALLEEDVAGVICSRGGYGSQRILRLLDWQKLAGAPVKPFIGFSDVGAFQLNLLSRSGWRSYSGLQAALGLGGDSTDRARNLLRGMLSGEMMQLGWPSGEQVVLQPVRAGGAGGILIPICLSILVSLIGTPFLPELEGAMLCLEDVNEPPYRIDRMCWQLREAGVLDGITALILGEFGHQNQSLARVVESIALDTFQHLDFPIWSGIPYGHIRDRLTLIMGARAKITADGALQYREAAV